MGVILVCFCRLPLQHKL